MLVSFKGTLHLPHLSSEPNEKLGNKYSNGSQNTIVDKDWLEECGLYLLTSCKPKAALGWGKIPLPPGAELDPGRASHSRQQATSTGEEGKC